MTAKDQDYVRIKGFVDKIPHKTLCRAALACNSNARALLHLEKHIKAKPEDFTNCVPILQQVIERYIFRVHRYFLSDFVSYGGGNYELLTQR